MYKTNLSMVVVAVIALTLLIALNPSQAEDIYRWVDESGTVHFANDPASIPEGKRKQAEVIQGEAEGSLGTVEVNTTYPQFEIPEPDLGQQSRDEEALREFWRNLALEIETREQAVLREIEITKEQLDYKKREVDYLLINGFFADRSILELRYLENLLFELERQLAFIEQEKESLRREARREGIPPGYLRP